MGSTVLVAVVTIIAVVEAARIRRESDCDKSTLAFNECVKKAYDTYVADHGAGDDGRGDWEARKSCIYVNSAIGECGDVLADCYEEDEILARKDQQVETILDQLKRDVGGWDSSKCPVVSDYLERKAGNDGEEVADGDQVDEDGAEEEDAADGEEGDEEVNDDEEEADGEEGDGEEGDDEEGGAEEGDAEDDNAEDGDGQEGDDEEGAEEGDAEEGNAEDGDGEEGDDEEGDESEDAGEGDEDSEEDAGEEDDESSSPILISSFMMVLGCLLAA